MNELIIDKINELMGVEIEGETEDESESRDFVLDTLKVCVSQSGDMHINSIGDKDKDRINLIAIRQTINVFHELYEGAALRKMHKSIKFGTFLFSLSGMTHETSVEAVPTTMRSVLGAMSVGAYDP